MKKSTWFGIILGLSSTLFFTLPSKAEVADSSSWFPSVPKVKFTSIGAHVGSWHSNNQDGRWNNSNPGVFGTISVANKEYIFGTYYNSERKQTYYAGYNWRPYSWLSVPIVVASGYDNILVAPVPTIHIPVYGKLTANVSVLPKVNSSGAWVIHLSTQYRF